MKHLKRFTAIAMSVVLLALSPCLTVKIHAAANPAAYSTTAAFCNSFLCAVKSNGQLCIQFPDNSYHLLNDPKAPRSIPIKIDTGVKSISTFNNTILAVKSNNQLWSIEVKDPAGLLEDIKNPQNYITRKKLIDNVASISNGNKEYQVAIKTNGDVYAWNRNFESKFSTKYTEDTPVKIMTDAVSISTGASHTMALKANGELWGWGDNSLGQLGNGECSEFIVAKGDSSDFSGPFDPQEYIDYCFIESFHPPKHISYYIFLEHMYKNISNGGVAFSKNPNETIRETIKNKYMEVYFTEILYNKADLKDKELGSVYCHIKKLIVDNPIKIMNDVAMVSAGTNHTAAVKTNGDLYVWGSNNLGQLGDNQVTFVKSTQEEVYNNLIRRNETVFHRTLINNNSPKPKKIIDDVSYAYAGDGFTLAVKTNGELWAWGDNTKFQYRKEKSLTPIKIMDNVAYVSSNGESTLVIKTNGDLWVCGQNTGGSLGYDSYPFSRPTTFEKVMDKVLIPKEASNTNPKPASTPKPSSTASKPL